MRKPSRLTTAFVGTTLFVASVLASAPLDRAAIQEATQKARAAYDAKDYAGFLQWSGRLAELSPRSTRGLYNLACARALSGQAEGAVEILDRLTRMGVATDAARDSDFDGIRTQASFQAMLERTKELETRVGSSEAAFTLPDRELITEAVAYDPKTRAFFVSSVRKRKVVRRGPDGKVTDFTKAADGLLAAIGLAVDGTRRTLWVTTEGFPQMEGFRKEDEGRSFLLEYDLDKASLRRRIAPPAGIERAELSDLTVGPGGDVFVSDPVTGRVYVLRPRAKALTVLVDEGPIGSAQGIVPSPDGRSLFVADYVQGIVRIEAATGAARLLPAPADAAVTGIDGLVFAGGALVGVQNGLRPHRVVRLRLDAAQEQITAVDTLERNHPAFDEPTVATVVDGDVYYVANSQYDRVKKDGSLDLEHLQPPTILRLRPGR